MALDGKIVLGDHPFDLVATSQMPSGKRAISRELRPSQPTDASRLGQATWQLSGPQAGQIGRSREGEGHVLATDYADNLETLYEDLLTASAAPNAHTLTAPDPPDTGTSAMLGEFFLGGAVLGGGSSGASAGNAQYADMQNNYLFVSRGGFTTQINSSFSPVQTHVHGQPVAGVANWAGFGWLGLGSGAPLQKRTGVTSTGSTYTDHETGGEDSEVIYAGDLKRGNDRLWYVAADINRAKYAYETFTVTGPLGGIIVGDDQKPLTAIGTLGPYTAFGASDGLFGFTDAGKPVVIVDLDGEESLANGSRWAANWGWLYAITDLGLRAWTPNIANPVGIESMAGFDGPIDGRPTAIWEWRGDLFVAYLTTAGNTYIIRGKFGPGTDGTGQPLWYPFKKLSSTECQLLYATPRSFATNPRIIAGEGSNIVSYIMGLRGRDIADSAYQFSTEGGQWFGTTMTRGQNLRKYLRSASFHTEQCAVGKTWQFAVSCDGGSYVNVGAAVAGNGHQIVRPASGPNPLETVSFNTLKPRLTQVNSSATTPPLIRGSLTVTYDERPDMIEDVTALVLVNNGGWERLKALADRTTDAPIRVSLPGDADTHYGFVTSLGPRQDQAADGVEYASVSIQLWRTS